MKKEIDKGCSEPCNILVISAAVFVFIYKHSFINF